MALCSTRPPYKGAVPICCGERYITDWVPMGCAETFMMRLPDDFHQAARDVLAHRPRAACGSRRSLAGHSPDTPRSTSYPR